MTKKKQLLIIASVVTGIICALSICCFIAGYYFREWQVVLFGGFISTFLAMVYGGIIVSEIKESRKQRK